MKTLINTTFVKMLLFVFRAPPGPTNVGRALLFSACPSFRCCGHSNLVIFNRISFKFRIWIASIELLFKLEYGFCPTNDNQGGRQNGHRLQVCFCGHSTLVIYYLIASKFHTLIIFINLSPKYEYGLCRIAKMATNRATTCQFVLVDTLT